MHATSHLSGASLTFDMYFFYSQDEVRIQKSTKQKDTLEAVKNSVRLLNEMLAHFSPQGSTDGDKELLKVGHP